MPSPNDAPGTRMLLGWRRLSAFPGGRWLFNKLIGRTVPYTGALGARLVTLEPGHAVAVLDDRRGVRNHLRSIHALALANLAELASGSAMLTALPQGTRGIVTRLEIDYLKKARGTLTATADVTVPTVLEPTFMHPEAEIRDSAGDVVARARVTWKVSPDTRAATAAPLVSALETSRATAASSVPGDE